jgi:hypothetical protein
MDFTSDIWYWVGLVAVSFLAPMSIHRVYGRETLSYIMDRHLLEYVGAVTFSYWFVIRLGEVMWTIL